VTDAPKNQGNLDLSQFLIRASSIQRLRQLLNLPVTTISNWWSTTSRIHTAHYVDYLADEQPNIPSPYDELFQNKSVTKPVDEAFALNSTRDELQNPSPLANPITISSHGPTVTAALAISARELSLLLGAEVQDKLNLTNLWELYRRTSLAKALDLSVSDFISAKAFVGSDPLGSPAATLRFVESINEIRSSRFSLAEIDYLVRHQFSPSESIAPTDESIAFVLDEIRAGLQKIAAENSFTSNTNDPEGNLTRRKLAVVLPESQVATAMTLLDGSWKDDSVSSQTEKRTFVDTYFAKFLDTADARAKLIGSGSLTSGEQRFLYILQNLLSYLRTSLSESFVSQKLAEALKLETEVSENLLRRWITSPATTGQACMADFLDPVFALSDTTIKVTPAAFHRQFKTYTRLHKVALIIGKLEMTARQLHWLFDYGIPAQFLDLNRMPTPLTGDPFEPSPAFEKWLRLGDLVSLSRTFSMGEAMLDDLLSKGNAVPTNATNAIKNTGKQTYIEALLRWTNWNELDLEFFLGKRDDSTSTGSLGFAFPNDYRGEQILVRLERCFSQLARVGLSAAQANAIAQASITATDARSVKQAAKAKYSDAQWAKLARPLRDALREKQRAALVAYLVTTQRLISADELYGKYLLDVEMSPCMLTTRIKQAASSVQLFIQRCLLNLESVSPNVIDRDQWQWMKRYRLWEANRKVFLYPENWIEPELRDDKSPFFRDLENELLQGDVRDDSAEIALVHYLEKLSEVARLEMVGMCTQNEPAAGDRCTARFRTHLQQPAHLLLPSTRGLQSLDFMGKDQCGYPERSLNSSCLERKVVLVLGHIY
jgi:hypothetical protein